MKSNLFQTILTQQNIHPVLFDVGASGDPPSIWKPLASKSIYVGFDPDSRDLREIANGQFYKGIIVNKAVSSDPQTPETTFYLTKSPYCSSTLHPDNPALSNYLFADLFTVVGQVTVPSTTLDVVVEQLDLSGIDWIKLDSQGTDLRLVTSLKEETLRNLLAVDVEPGLIDAYKGEDLFVDAHKYLVENGFWLSNLIVRGSVRIKQTTLQEIVPNVKGITSDFIQKSARISPGWCEARYFRTPESLQQIKDSKRAHILLWVFALIDQQIGFALDLAVGYKQAFGEDAMAYIMMQESVAFAKKKLPMSLLKKAVDVLVRKGKRFFDR